MMRLTISILVTLSSLALTSCTPAKNDPPALPPRVAVIHPNRGPVERTITLPGDLAGYYQSALYSKVTGYLKSISVDKGDFVKSGQVLAIIEVPELAQQVDQARASLEIARLTYARLQSVWHSDPRLVARQDVDIANAKYQEAKASLDELLAMNSYTQITAPFDGVITERFVDPGALIHAGGEQNTVAPMQGSARAGGSGAPVVSLARLDRLRIYLYVPQDEVSAVRQSMPATVTVQGLAKSHFSGTVVRFSHSLDLATRTMLTEVDLENPGRTLYPGMYANVTLVLTRHRDAMRLPVAAVGGDDGQHILIVRDGRIAAAPVTVGIHDGPYLEITSGLSVHDLVVRTYSNSLEPGETVTADLQPPAFAAASASGH
ncbi:MAG: efflux RND transporter periplasmic adaptor subunit [Candidatus Binataceae bacterium]|nr:efflux RND transporter periplasmic adaptor subunit [Candidatus Binataceae bacterium]